MLETGVQSICC